MVDKALSAWDGVNALVNNTGIRRPVHIPGSADGRFGHQEGPGRSAFTAVAVLAGNVKPMADTAEQSGSALSRSLSCVEREIAVLREAPGMPGHWRPHHRLDSPGVRHAGQTAPPGSRYCFTYKLIRKRQPTGHERPVLAGHAISPDAASIICPRSWVCVCRGTRRCPRRSRKCEPAQIGFVVPGTVPVPTAPAWWR